MSFIHANEDLTLPAKTVKPVSVGPVQKPLSKALATPGKQTRKRKGLDSEVGLDMDAPRLTRSKLKKTG